MNNLKISDVQEIITLAQVCYPVGGEPKVLSLSDITFEDAPGERELHDKVSSLSSNELAELRALMILGRAAGGETVSDWDGLVSEAEAVAAVSSNVELVHYVASKYPLPQYLRTGLEVLGL
ncbi:DUF3775 domain-containing protein [Vibrio splendidus]